MNRGGSRWQRSPWIFQAWGEAWLNHSATQTMRLCCTSCFSILTRSKAHCNPVDPKTYLFSLSQGYPCTDGPQFTVVQLTIFQLYNDAKGMYIQQKPHFKFELWSFPQLALLVSCQLPLGTQLYSGWCCQQFWDVVFLHPTMSPKCPSVPRPSGKKRKTITPEMKLKIIIHYRLISVFWAHLK